MQEIMEYYGKGLQSVLVFLLLVTMLFVSITDAQGKQGIAAIVGDNMAVYEERAPDFSTYEEESRKAAPMITSQIKTAVLVGEHVIDEFLLAKDYAGGSLKLWVKSVQRPTGELDAPAYDAENGKLLFAEVGIYVITVYTIDTENRYTECTVRIPVNRG